MRRSRITPRSEVLEESLDSPTAVMITTASGLDENCIWADRAKEVHGKLVPFSDPVHFLCFAASSE